MSDHNNLKHYLKYQKKPTTFAEQIRILKERGMAFKENDSEKIKKILQRIGYHHLTLY